LGYVVSEASNTQSALAQIAEGEAVDLVFSDIVLPGGPSGFDMCATLHKENPKIAVLLTSGHASAAYRSQQDPSALVDILAKPYSLRELAFAVRRSLTAGH
jgi:CheY-like chemotaxis protein